MTGPLWRSARRLASLKVTLASLAAAAVVALLGEDGRIPVGLYIALPFAVLFVNLAAALATNAAIRAQAGLLGFHLALAALALLIAADRLTALYGHVEVTEGAPFDPGLVTATAGPLHPWRLDRIAFSQGRFEIAYAPGMRRRDTDSEVHVRSSGGRWRRQVVGDDRPLVAAGYRFYTSFNKGFAPVLSFADAAGVVHSGAVHLPSYPLNYFNQGNAWTLPGTAYRVKLWLRIAEPVYVEEAAWRFRKPDGAVLVLLDGGRRHELRPGDAVPLAGGLLRYRELRGWMGYTISYNPLMPWILAAVSLGVLCLGWHVFARLRRSPWEAAPPPREAADVR